MPLLIDGYNLLHVTGITGVATETAGAFQRSREALLNLLSASIPPEEVTQATVVFDAADAPPGLPRTVTHRGMTVRYASEYSSADALIEELIRQHSAPKSLTVVSSDHRIQRAARRRRASFIDSDRWFAELWKKRLELEAAKGATHLEKPVNQLTAEEVEYWVKRFSSE